MATDGTNTADAAEALRVNEKKWIKPLMEAGWTCIPSVIIERQRALGLDAIDINILMHLATHWWTEDNKPYPSKVTIATALDITSRTVQRRIAAMERDGFIRRSWLLRVSKELFAEATSRLRTSADIVAISATPSFTTSFESELK